MANAAGNMVTVLKHCRISPPPLDHSVTETPLPLTFFDLSWINWPSLSRVYYYDLPCSATEFTQTLVPQLKKSLASTLKHYFPFCGNVIIPTTLPNNNPPAIRYLEGDSVSLTIAEFSSTSSNGFDHLSAHHARDVDDLFSLIPELPPGDTATLEDEIVKISPVLSVQVTLFPNKGFSVGFRNSHLVADGKSMCNFIATWASINAKQLKSEDDYNSIKTLPFYDRSVIKDTKEIASIFLKKGLDMAQHMSKAPAPAAQKIDRVQATFILNRAQIQGLKDIVLSKLPYVSTFIVVCAYVWTCMAKTSIALGEEIDDEKEVEENFIFAIDARARLDPPIPSNYFGNAVSPGLTTLKLSRLVGQEGLVYAAEEMKKVLHEQINNDEGVLKGLDLFFDKIETIAKKGQKIFGVTGSPKFDYYSTDFGWGKPKKYEVVSEKFALVGSSDSDGGLEIGFCFSKNEMDAFTNIFTQGFIT